ncbi:GGDEF domain-containing protein [Sulfurospirillum diekertiae]|uniref:Cyclic-di-GMP phosphodiesterase YjcC n=1 Tax=Sulfurospirillum diekertiae TaxID=1854492 RepID=A0A1Y0HN39_9BACT|nr:GGDEF domain-containing protein [Sulfurospirillum diekertiae]ARU49539.1 Putative cyclic-di-GMP phosphodiesterase YjcC [Sulfurospirillum diekertiae]ASC94342.1 Putative cyclic-di-GMP phosphodiesterase YjcC [Sulfurospirillum diekertiae]
MLNEKWQTLIDVADFAFQPIVNIYTGKLYAVEALIRNYEPAGFTTIDCVFDSAYSEKTLYSIDVKLREKAIHKFSLLPFSKHIKLFYNLDNRITMMPDFKSGYTCELLSTYEMDTSNICFELSEKHQVGMYAGVDKLVLNLYKQQGYKMAIDDFGVGFSGLQMLFNADPNFIKIDRFFICDIHLSKKKKLFVSSIVQIAQAMGIFTIAEGVECEEEYNECKKLGCNMVQGYFVQKPTLDVTQIVMSYEHLKLVDQSDKRKNGKIANIEKYLQKSSTVFMDSPINDVYEVLKGDKKNHFVPVLARDQTPLGIIRDADIKAYLYSNYGKALLYNLTQGSLKKIIAHCGRADINDPIEKILKIYAFDDDNDAILITENEKYLGYLSSKVLLDIVNEKNIVDAKDQNPLTGLSGNRIINEFVANAMDSKEKVMMAYFDFDNFKPFNDYYGFRKGDRAITLFADILKSSVGFDECLVGHVGGDDFFLGWSLKEEDSFEKVYAIVLEIVTKFSEDIKSFYCEQGLSSGYIMAKNRDGVIQQFPLMTVSAAVICHGFGYQHDFDDNELNEIFGVLKKSAKASSTHIACVDLGVIKDAI